MENQEWLAALRGGEPDRGNALDELRAMLVRGLSNSFARRYGGGLQADDVAQEALIKILNSLDGFEGRSRFTTWAMTIATRVAISEMRRKHYKDVSLSALDSSESLRFEIEDTDESRPEEGLDRRRVLAALGQLVETRLTEKQRVATQALLDGIPVDEIARRSSSNRNAVYKLIHDARSRLRDGFVELGFSPEDILSIFS